jgi:hypothetical protein
MWKISSWTDSYKSKVFLCLTKHNAMKTYLGIGDIAPGILDLGTRWRWVVSFTSRPLYPQGKRPWYQLDRRVGGPQNWSGPGGEEKNSQSLLGLEPPIIQPITQRYTTELFPKRKIHIPRRESNPSHPARSLVAIPIEIFRILDFQKVNIF